MDVRDLTHELILETPSLSPDGAGGYVREWAELGRLWGAMRHGYGTDIAGVGATLGRVPWRITVRAAPHGAPSRPQAGQRFRSGERVLAIRAVAEADARARFLMCFAEEEVAA